MPPIRPDDDPDDAGDDLPPTEAARARRRDHDAAAAARSGMRTGLAKQFKQVLDAQAKRARAALPRGRGGPRRGRRRRDRASAQEARPPDAPPDARQVRAIAGSTGARLTRLESAGSRARRIHRTRVPGRPLDTAAGRATINAALYKRSLLCGAAEPRLAAVDPDRSPT